MAFRMSPVGKKKCSYSPMQKKGLINPSPVKETTPNNGGSSTTAVTKPAIGIRTFTGGHDNITQTNDFERRTADFNKTPEGQRLKDTVNKMSEAMVSGDFKSGKPYFTNSSGEATYFTEDDYKNASGRYVQAKNASVGQKSLADRGKSGGKMSSYMDSSVLRDVVSINKEGKNVEVANLNENQDFADYPTYGDDAYYQGIADKKAQKIADEKAYAKKQSDAAKSGREIYSLQKQIRKGDLSGNYQAVLNMPKGDKQNAAFKDLLDKQRAMNKSQSSEVTKPSVNE